MVLNPFDQTDAGNRPGNQQQWFKSGVRIVVEVVEILIKWTRGMQCRGPFLPERLPKRFQSGRAHSPPELNEVGRHDSVLLWYRRTD
jgi:hypothetical protein